MRRPIVAPAVRRLSIVLALAAAGLAACSNPVAPREGVTPRVSPAAQPDAQSAVAHDSVTVHTNVGGNQPWM